MRAPSSVRPDGAVALARGAGAGIGCAVTGAVAGLGRRAVLARVSRTAPARQAPPGAGRPLIWRGSDSSCSMSARAGGRQLGPSGAVAGMRAGGGRAVFATAGHAALAEGWEQARADFGLAGGERE